MDIRNVSQEEKKEFIEKAKAIFGQIRNVLDIVECDMQKEDLMVQASAVWIAGNLGNWFYDFMKELRNIDKMKNDVQKQMMDIDIENAEPNEVA